PHDHAGTACSLQWETVSSRSVDFEMFRRCTRSISCNRDRFLLCHIEVCEFPIYKRSVSRCCTLTALVRLKHSLRGCAEGSGRTLSTEIELTKQDWTRRNRWGTEL